MPYTITKTTSLRSRNTPALKDSPNLHPSVAAALARIGHGLRNHPALRSRSITISPDGLTRTTITVWDSRAAYADFRTTHDADLSLVARAATLYQQDNGIAVNTYVTKDD